MPDAIAPAAPAAPAAPITTGGGNASPAITPGGGQPTTPPASQPSAKPAEATGAEGTEPFEFKFEGDEETYRERQAEEAGKPEDRYDASKPFDPELRELLKGTPDKLKQVERNHFELRQWQKSGFKTAQDAAKHQQDLNGLVQSLGRTDGLKGLEAVKAEAGEWATTMQGFQSGDPAVIDQWFADNPEGMSKLMGPAINKFAEQNPGAYAHEMSKVFAATLNNIGEGGFSALQAFNFLVDKIGKDPENAKFLNILGGVFNAIYSNAKNAPNGEASKSPQLEAREKALAQKETSLYQNEVVSRSIPFRSDAIKQAIGHAFKGMNLSTDSRRDITANIERLLLEAQKKDDTYKNNGMALLRAKDTDGFLKAYKASITRNLPEVARRVRRTFAGITSADRKAEAQSRTEAGGSVNAGGPQKMPYTGQLQNGGPPPAVINYSLMRQKYGREGTSEMLSRREFLQKDKGEVVFTW